MFRRLRNTLVRITRTIIYSDLFQRHLVWIFECSSRYKCIKTVISRCFQKNLRQILAPFFSQFWFRKQKSFWVVTHGRFSTLYHRFSSELLYATETFVRIFLHPDDHRCELKKSFQFVVPLVRMFWTCSHLWAYIFFDVFN